MLRKLRKLWAPALLLASTAACAGGDGNLSIRLDGEEGAREGIPSVHSDGAGGEAEDIDFADGWEIHFDRYLVSLNRLEIRDGSGNEGFASNTTYVYDISSGTPEIELLSLPAQRWDQISFDISSPGEELTLDETVSEADAESLRGANATYFIAGGAHHEATGRELTFSFLVDAGAALSACTNGEDDTQGVVVRPNATTEASLTFHVEHLFFTDLASEGSDLRFEAMAAMADENGHITMDDLANQSLADLRDADGNPLVDATGSPVIYDPGGASLPSNDLAAFVREAVRTQAHLNGGGLCTLSPL